MLRTVAAESELIERTADYTGAGRAHGCWWLAAGGGRWATGGGEAAGASVRGGRRHCHSGQRRAPADGATQAPPGAPIGPPEKVPAYPRPAGLSRTSPTLREPEPDLRYPSSALLGSLACQHDSPTHSLDCFGVVLGDPARAPLTAQPPCAPL